MGETDVRDTVQHTVAELLGIDPIALAATDDLRELPGFDSFRMVEIIEHLERRLAVEIDPDELIPAHLMHLDSLCSMFRRAVAGAAARQ
jgi:acyl carrier protein